MSNTTEDLFHGVYFTIDETKRGKFRCYMKNVDDKTLMMSPVSLPDMETAKEYSKLVMYKTANIVKDVSTDINEYQDKIDKNYALYQKECEEHANTKKKLKETKENFVNSDKQLKDAQEERDKAINKSNRIRNIYIALASVFTVILIYTMFT